MARVESGRRRIKRHPTLLNDVLGEAAMSVAGAAEAKKQKLVIEGPATHIETDARALVQVLVHLARNAIDHTGEGGTVKIIAKLYPHHVGVHVAGTGAGLRSRLSASAASSPTGTDVTKASPGTSLGFAMARSLVELQGGRLRVRSRAGSGSVVVLSLPRQPMVDHDTAKAA
jgi:two-component system cell cycle sensor histidine kinase PleC